MPDSPNPGQSYEAWIESKAGQCPPSQTQLFIREMAARWPMPQPPPYAADDEGEAEPDE